MKYRDLFTDEIIDEETYEEELEAEIESWMDESTFDDWLNGNYQASKIFQMAEMERQKVFDEFYDWACGQAEGNMMYEPVEEEE